MAENHTDHLHAEALLYACGEMDTRSAAAFEARLANEQVARDALIHAAELLSPAASGPTLAYRDSARRRLTKVAPPFLRRPFIRSVLSALAGAAAATLFFVVLDPLGGSDLPPTAPIGAAAAAPRDSADSSSEEIYSDLSNVDRLARIHSETMSKRSRQDDFKQHHPVLNVVPPMNRGKGSMM